MKRIKLGVVSSFTRRRESGSSGRLAQKWIPVFTGMTIFCQVLQFNGSMPFINGFDSTAYAQSDWKEEFADVCGKTRIAMELSVEELRSYIERCNRLEDRLHELNGPGGSEKKVYGHRLKMCRNLYVYTLSFREEEK